MKYCGTTRNVLNKHVKIQDNYLLSNSTDYTHNTVPNKIEIIHNRRKRKKRGNNNIDRVKININKQKRTSNLNTSLDSETI